jgi:hypothetical protein
VVGPRWLGVGEGTETPDRIHEPRGVVRIELEWRSIRTFRSSPSWSAAQ